MDDAIRSQKHGAEEPQGLLDLFNMLRWHWRMQERVQHITIGAEAWVTLLAVRLEVSFTLKLFEHLGR